MMKRREFIAGLGAAAAWPVVARAQQGGTIIRIGLLSPNTVKSSRALGNFQAFRSQLRELDLSEGRNFSIEYKDIDDPRGMAVAVAELMQTRPDIIVAGGPEIVLQMVSRT